MLNQTEARAGVGLVLANADERAPRRRLGRLWNVIRANPLGMLGGFLILVLVVGGLFAPLIAPHTVNEYVGKPGLSPARNHVFGTDKFGQDIFSRVVHGARISLRVGFFAVGLGT